MPDHIEPISLKTFSSDKGVLVVEWTKAEVVKMNKFEFLQYAIVGKFAQVGQISKTWKSNFPTQGGI